LAKRNIINTLREIYGVEEKCVVKNNNVINGLDREREHGL
jgi:hypothetical protein